MSSVERYVISVSSGERKGKPYLVTSELCNSTILNNCANDGYEFSLIEIVEGKTQFQPGDILIYSGGHTSVLASVTHSYLIPTNLITANQIQFAVYGAGKDFTTVHRYRLQPEIENLGSSDRPYTHIIRVTRT